MAENQSGRMEQKMKGRSGIPIPSFSNAVLTTACAAATKRSDEGDDNNDEKRTPAAVVMTPNWNVSLLCKTEGALRVHRLRRVGPMAARSKWSSDGLLPLQDFYALVRRQALVDTSKDALMACAADPHGLLLSERLLCDLLCASSPVLYQLTKNADGHWCLQMMNYKGNRMEKLRRLAAVTESNVDKRNSVVQAIREHRESLEKSREACKDEKESAMGTNETTTSTTRLVAPLHSTTRKKFLEPFIRADMTLEDRVQARANAKRKRETDLASSSSRNKATRNPDGIASGDYPALLRLADAMWSYSKKGLGRQPALFFSITVKQVVQLFSASLVSCRRGAASAQKQHLLAREKATRAELLQALRDLHRLVPEWISFSSSSRLSKDTFVRLSSTADYASVRTKLGAPKPSHAKKLRPSLRSATHNKAVVMTRAAAASSPVAAAAARVSLSPPVAKLKSTIGFEHHDSSSSSSLMPRVRTTKGASPLLPRSASSLRASKRPAQESSSSPTTSSKPSGPNKTKPRLSVDGVNKRLTFTNAHPVDSDKAVALEAKTN